jgi:Flp pilus assembly protein TadD
VRVLLPPTLVTLALITLVCLRPLLADIAYWQSQQSTRPPVERLAAGERAVRLWPLEPEYRLGLAWAYLQSGDFPAAEGQLGAAGHLSPRDPKVWAALGELYAYWGESEAGRFTQAEAAYRQAVALAPNVATTHTSLGLVLAQQGRLEEGLAELERAVALDATDGIAYRHLADLYHTLGREEKADWAEKEAERWSDE